MPLLRLTLSAVSGDSGLVEYPGSNSFHPRGNSFQPVSTALDSIASTTLHLIVLDSIASIALDSIALDFLVWVDLLMSSQP